MKELEISKSFEIQEFQKDDKAGTLSGYATTYGNVDLTGDIIAQGAFSEWLLKEKSVPLLYGHSEDIKNILGSVVFEDRRKGLYFNSNLDLDLPNSKTAYQLVKKGLLNSVSIRFGSDKYSFDNNGMRVFQRGEIRELSLVMFPANPMAVITEVKSMNKESIKTIRDFENFLRDVGFSKKEATSIASHGFKASKSDSCFDELESIKKMLENNLNTLRG